MKAKALLRLPLMLKRALTQAVAHDFLNLGQSAAYSAIVALFPALIVVAALVAVLPDITGLKGQIGYFVREILPAPVFPIVRGYFVARTPQTVRALITAALVSLVGASSVMSILMEGLARAEMGARALAGDPAWSFWQVRKRATLLAMVAGLPLLVATVLVMFGQYLAVWVDRFLPVGMHAAFLGTVLVVRWVVALAGVAGVTSLVYHIGSPQKKPWRSTVPGAVVATLLWAASTVGFGFYVTRFANYREVYGSLGTGIALLVWLYLVFLSVLSGAEFNVQYFRGTQIRTAAREG